MEVGYITEYAIKSTAEVAADLNEKLIRVLHVDDAGLLRIARQRLEMEGQFQVDTACSVKEAIEKMKRESYDTIVTDFQMPEKDGLAFLKELRESGGEVIE